MYCSNTLAAVPSFAAKVVILYRYLFVDILNEGEK
jgi:hypothetical protein